MLSGVNYNFLFISFVFFLFFCIISCVNLHFFHWHINTQNHRYIFLVSVWLIRAVNAVWLTRIEKCIHQVNEMARAPKNLFLLSCLMKMFQIQIDNNETFLYRGQHISVLILVWCFRLQVTSIITTSYN